MISQETKNQIETEMLKLYPIKDGRRVSPTGHTIMFDVNIERRVGAIEGATKYAEKLEEKDKEIATAQSEREGWNRISVDYAIALEKAEKIIESKDRKLAQLKEIAEKVNFALRDLDLMLDIVDPQIPRKEIHNKVIQILEMSTTLNGANKT